MTKKVTRRRIQDIRPPQRKVMTKKDDVPERNSRRITLLTLAVFILAILLTASYTQTYYISKAKANEGVIEKYEYVEKTKETTKEIKWERRTLHVTGYNTVPEQTDSTPCIASSGDNICGRKDTVACPRNIPLGTKIEIDGREYTCLDRLAPKYDNRIDVNCDKDKQCPYNVTGVKEVIIKIK